MNIRMPKSGGRIISSQQGTLIDDLNNLRTRVKLIEGQMDNISKKKNLKNPYRKKWRKFPYNVIERNKKKIQRRNKRLHRDIFQQPFDRNPQYDKTDRKSFFGNQSKISNI